MYEAKVSVRWFVCLSSEAGSENYRSLHGASAIGGAAARQPVVSRLRLTSGAIPAAPVLRLRETREEADRGTARCVSKIMRTTFRENAQK